METVVRPQEDVEEFGRDHGLIHEAVVTGRKVGAGREFWARLAHDETLFGKVVTFVACGDFEPTASQKRAREIMGRNFFGIEEAVKYFGVNPTRQQLAALSEISFSEATLKVCKETHILVAVFPLSILDIRGKVQSGQRLFYDQHWYNKESFAKDRGETAWHLIRKTPVANSTSKTWDGQQALLAKNEETPTAQVMVYTIIGHFLATGGRLFENVYVRCSNVGSDGDRVDVGRFDSLGLRVKRSWGGDRHGDIDVASARKSD